MSWFLELLEPRRLLSASTAMLNADMSQLQHDEAAARRDAAACLRSLLVDVTSLNRDVNRLPNTAANRTLVNQLRTDLRGVGGGVLFGVGTLITSVTRDSNAVRSSFLANQRHSTSTTQAALLNTLGKLASDITTGQTTFTTTSTAAQTKLLGDLTAIAAANPSATTLLSHITSTETDVAGCISKITGDAGNIQSDISKLENDLGGQPLVQGTFTDTTFNDADWEVVLIPTGPGGTASAQQVTAGGDLGPFRSITISLNTPSATEDSQVAIFSGKLDAIWYPNAADAPAGETHTGPISSVDYSEYAKLIAGQGNGQATGLAVKQGGIVYFVQQGGGLLTTPDFAWTPKQVTGIVPTNFIAIINGNGVQAHPDFSASGAPIEFGFIRITSSPAGRGDAGTRTAGIDNWSVTVNP
jgi:hypothetical protein